MKQQIVRAPAFPENFIWLNTTKKISLNDLRGYVVVLDFWTFACINCMHAIPELAKLEKAVRDKPVVIIGIHSAKFDHEQRQTSIQAAIDRTGITHPVLIDEDFTVWNAYSVRAWPTFVLIDAEGYVREQHAGERKAEELEDLVTQLVNEGRKRGVIATTPLAIAQKPKKQTTTLVFPGKIDIDPAAKRAIIADTNNNRVLVCSIDDRTIFRVQTVIGTGKEGEKDGLFDEASFNKPQGVAIDGNTIIICDTNNHRVRKANLESRHVSTIFGTGERGTSNTLVGSASETAIASPWDVTMNGNDIYIAAAGTHQIWQYDRTTKHVERFAGSGAEGMVDGPSNDAQLAQPSGLSIANDTLYVADSESSAIRATDLKTRATTTLVGTGLFTFGHKNGRFEDALLQHPIGLDAATNEIIVADSFNHAIRKLDLATHQTETLIGNPIEQEPGELFEPNDVHIVKDDIYIVDTNNHAIKVYNRTTQAVEDVAVIDPEKTHIKAQKKAKK